MIVQFPAGKPLISTLPVANVHVGCVTVPVITVAGVAGCASIVALVEADEVHPEDVKVTVNVYVVLADNPEKLAVAVEPVIVAPPGFAVTVHAVTGKPLNATVAVAVAHVG